MNLTIAYLTNRIEPKIDWFFDSLERQFNVTQIKIVVVDFYKDVRPLNVRGALHVSPKPTVWQGKHRLTKEDYFAASNARNTAICYAQDGYIAFVDDLSVLMPAWFQSVRESVLARKKQVVCGAYRKVKNLEIENGKVKSFVVHRDAEGKDVGLDSRWNDGSDSKLIDIGGGRLFGCSLVAPVEAFLEINGWPEICDSVGGEDYIAGMVLENNGYKIMYDRRMLTCESEEHHYYTTGTHAGWDNGVIVASGFRRIDKGVSPNDKSHRIIEVCKGEKRFNNYFGDGGIRELRNRILNGELFPVKNIPEHDFFDGQPLSEM